MAMLLTYSNTSTEGKADLTPPSQKDKIPALNFSSCLHQSGEGKWHCQVSVLIVSLRYGFSHEQRLVNSLESPDVCCTPLGHMLQLFILCLSSVCFAILLLLSSVCVFLSFFFFFYCCCCFPRLLFCSTAICSTSNTLHQANISHIIK